MSENLDAHLHLNYIHLPVVRWLASEISIHFVLSMEILQIFLDCELILTSSRQIRMQISGEECE